MLVIILFSGPSSVGWSEYDLRRLDSASKSTSFSSGSTSSGFGSSMSSSSEEYPASHQENPLSTLQYVANGVEVNMQSTGIASANDTVNTL